MVWLVRSLGRRCLGDGVDDIDRRRRVFRAYNRGVVRRRRMGKPIVVTQTMIVDMFGCHPDLDLDRDCVVLNSEDIRELRWLDAEIGLEHLAGLHGGCCPYGCLFNRLR